MQELIATAGPFGSATPIMAHENERRVIELPTGLLTVDVHEAELDLDSICAFAARRNPKRGFLFVSKVLGKHIPVMPHLIREVHTRLAAQIGNLPGPVVFIGMAETAIALGHGVFHEYARLSERGDIMFLHSTRYRLDNEVAVEFLEEHSHAADHIIYQPSDPRLKEMFRQARSLVLVDDEASTGKTFVNLVKNMAAAMPALTNIVTAVITDWRGPERTIETNAAIGYPVKTAAIIKGRYGFSPAPNLVAVDMPKVTGNGDYKDGLMGGNFGRLGVTAAHPLFGSAAYGFGLTGLCKKVLGRLNPGRVLVLGTGEFAYPPFVFAELLERQGVEVFYQSTTRSPIMEGLAIGSSLTFADNYGDGIPNFLYNARREDYDHVLICHETPAGSIDRDLVGRLGAETLEFRL